MDKKNRKNDIRVKYTQSVIKETLIRLLEKKALEKITVVELCNSAGINRATFYTHYSDLFDLMTQIKEEFKKNVIKHVKAYYSDENNAKASLTEFLRLLRSNSQLYSLLRKETDPNCLRRQMWESTRDMYLKKQSGQNAKVNFYEETYLLFRASGSTSVIDNWLDRESPIPEEELAGIIIDYVNRLK